MGKSMKNMKINNENTYFASAASERKLNIKLNGKNGKSKGNMKIKKENMNF